MVQSLGEELDRGNCPSERGRAYAVLVLLDLDDVAVLKGPPDNVRLVADALGVLGLLDGAPELVKLGELEEVPDVGEGGSDDGALNDLVGRGDGFLSRHGEDGWGVVLV